MSQSHLVSFVGLILCFGQSASQAQTTSRLEAAQLRSKPRADESAEVRRLKQNELMQRDRQPDYADAQDLLMIRPGEYVVAPDQYRPDNWSPLIHPRYDYSIFPNRGGNRLFAQRRRFGSFGPSRFGRGTYSNYSSGYGCYWGGPYQYSPYLGYGDAYIQGRVDSDREYLGYIAAQRAGQLLDQNRAKLDEGMEQFRAGAYDLAAVIWLGAAAADGSDAASRVHAGHALFAVGKYAEACKLLARAFELAPHLATSVYDIREDYAIEGDFDKHMGNLKSYIANHPGDGSGIAMLGYIRFYSEGPSSALKALNCANELCPNNAVIVKLLQVAQTVGSDAADETQTQKLKSSMVPKQRNTTSQKLAPGRIRI